MNLEYDPVRYEKLLKIKESGKNPYPERFSVTHTLSEARQLAEGTTDIAVAGRIVALRKHGKLMFGHLGDVNDKFQFAIDARGIGNEHFEFFSKTIEVGDHIGIRGDIFKTRTQEITILVKAYQILSKSLLPIPEKWHGLKDPELCYRKRYLDIIINTETKRRFQICLRSTQELRKFLDRHSFVECYTPIINTVASGAMATPFKSHHNALDIDVFFRIAPETYLKRLIISGFSRVYEFARCFRNEGISSEHLQDFTMIEAYAAYWNYKDNMAFTKQMIIEAVGNSTGDTCLNYQGRQIELEGDWPIFTMRELILEKCGIDIDTHKDANELRRVIKEKGIDLDSPDFDNLGRGNLIDLLYKRRCRPEIIEPAFLVGHPVELSPLARKSDTDKLVSDRFQIIIEGMELINGYSELADALEQEASFKEQARLIEAGDKEAMRGESDFVEALAYGMPPTSGWGMGLERFHKILTESDNLRDVIFFPLMRQKVSLE